MSQVQRRKFLIVTGVLLAAPRARAQQAEKVRRVGILVTNLRGGGASYVEAMKAGLRERGWIEGKNLEIDLRDPDGNTDLFRKLAAELVAAKPDVIFATTYLAVLAVTDETNTIPVVFAAISDPAKAGLVKSLSRPGGQLTGVDVLPHVRDVEPRGDVPVDVADVVARLVLAQIGEVHALAVEHAPVIALQDAVKPGLPVFSISGGTDICTALLASPARRTVVKWWCRRRRRNSRAPRCRPTFNFGNWAHTG